MRVLRAIGGSANGIAHLRFDDHSPCALSRSPVSGPTVIDPLWPYGHRNLNGSFESYMSHSCHPTLSKR